AHIRRRLRAEGRGPARGGRRRRRRGPSDLCACGAADLRRCVAASFRPQPVRACGAGDFALHGGPVFRGGQFAPAARRRHGCLFPRFGYFLFFFALPFLPAPPPFNSDFSSRSLMPRVSSFSLSSSSRSAATSLAWGSP